MGIHSKINNFIFWERWLFFSSLLFAFSGIGFAFFGNSFLFQAYNEMLAKVFWQNAHFPPHADIFRAFIYGPLGGTIACCYILLAYITKYAFKEKQKWAQNSIIIAFSVWVIIDSAVCIYFGVFAQIYIINIFSITVKALPIIFTWKDFRTKNPDTV